VKGFPHNNDPGEAMKEKLWPGSPKMDRAQRYWSRWKRIQG